MYVTKIKNPCGINVHKELWRLIKGRNRITGNSINKSWINSIKHPEGTVPSITRNFTILDTCWIKPKAFPVYKPNISVLVYTVNNIGYRRFCWNVCWGRRLWLLSHWTVRRQKCHMNHSFPE